jgi:type IV pilus secretin PilQ/predicted competence protein
MLRALIALLLVLAVPASAYRVTDVTVTASGDRTLVTVVADGPITYEKFLLTDPMRVVLDLTDAVHALPTTDFAVSRGGVSTLRTSQYKAPPDGIVRVIVDVTGELLNYNTSTDGNTLILSLQTNPAGTPFTAWSASSQSVEPAMLAGGSVQPLSDPVAGSYSGTYEYSAQGVVVSEPYNQPQDGFPVEWIGSGGRRVTIDVVDADIRTVLRSISDVSGLNIIVPENYESTVTAQLRNVGWRDALMAILNSQGLVATMEGSNVLRLSPREEFYSDISERANNRRERQNLQDLQTEVFVIRYAKAEDISAATSTVLTERGEISIDNRTNSLIVTDIPSKVNEIARLLPILDSPTAQVMIEAKLVEIDASASSELGIDWSLGNLSRTDALTHFGGEVGLGVGSPTGTLTFGTATSMFDVNAVLGFLEQSNRAHILSEPRIAIIDNMTGKVLSGKQVPLSLEDEAGNVYIQMFEVGVSLEVTPHINADNNITLELRPMVSDLSGEATSSNQPIILTQEANTTLMIDDGATAVIGGIMRNKQSTLERRIPILGYIPLIGDLLFTYQSTTTDNTELVIFVTPHIIRPY